MAVSINCCLRPSSPPTPIPPSNNTTSLQSRTTTVTPWSASLRRSCAVAAACIVIGSAVGVADGDNRVLAQDLRTVDGSPAQARWSDRRRCPPWRANLLENIVPENLPRPSARRRFNSITAVKRAPGVLVFSLPNDMGCFSL